MTTSAPPGWTLALLQMASPVLPIGAFSYSQGLEQAHAQAWVVDEASAGEWIASQYRCAFEPRELVALEAAFKVSGSITDLEALLAVNLEFLASRDSSEIRSESLQTGSALMKWLRSMQQPLSVEAVLIELIAGIGATKLTAPVAFALCAKAQSLPLEAARLAWAWSWLENQVQAAVKIIPLGQTAGQRLLIMLRSLLLREGEDSQSSKDMQDKAWSFTPLGNIAAMRHERLYTRIFRS
jgi:urease accessory protein